MKSSHPFSIGPATVGRFAFIGVAIGVVANMFGQTKTEVEQTRYPNSPGPALTVVFQDGSIRQVLLGPTLVLVNQGGVYTLNAVTSAATVPAQKLTLEPDNASWRIPAPYPNPAVYRNGLLMFAGLDYTLDPTSGIVRPSAAQGTKTADLWVAK